MRRKTFGTPLDRVAWFILLTALVLFSLPANAKLELSLPLQTVLLSPLRAVSAFRRHFGRLESENRRLSQLAAELAVSNARMQSELGRLPEPPATRHELVRAPIVAHDLTTMQKWLVVARGRRDGVFPGASVLAPRGVVGKVVKAGEHQAIVQTVLEPGSRLGVVSARSRAPALCRSSGAGMLVLEYAAKTADFLSGDTVVTSGTGRVFPRGLVVGFVISTHDRPTELFKTVTVRPAVDIMRLNEVFVFRISQPAESLWTDPWLGNLAPEEMSIPGTADGR